MPSFSHRDEFVSEVVDTAISYLTGGGHKLSPAIKRTVLDDVVVSDYDWAVVASGSAQPIDEEATKKVFSDAIVEVLHFFPLNALTESDLPVIAAASMIKYRDVVMACIWPIPDIIKRLQGKPA
ncbi:hypothetical protein [Kitasatospora acidiphila]|uniref:hypothetical protein n=1 Tax=Kitasatospora acidiphila TaxID=2567942 RepID=UPI003C712F8D